mgnify:CR=1 FL=1
MEFGDICGLANNGKGMSKPEMIRALASCLTGSRKEAYKVKLKAAKREGRCEKSPKRRGSGHAPRTRDEEEGRL